LGSKYSPIVVFTQGFSVDEEIATQPNLQKASSLSERKPTQIQPSGIL
jgi:hypothetical protein